MEYLTDFPQANYNIPGSLVEIKGGGGYPPSDSHSS
jgi:hypothetical protein